MHLLEAVLFTVASLTLLVAALLAIPAFALFLYSYLKDRVRSIQWRWRHSSALRVGKQDAIARRGAAWYELRMRRHRAVMRRLHWNALSRVLSFGAAAACVVLGLTFYRAWLMERGILSISAALACGAAAVVVWWLSLVRLGRRR